MTKNDFRGQMVKFRITDKVDKEQDDKTAMKIFKDEAKQSIINSYYASILNIVNEMYVEYNNHLVFMHCKSTKNIIHRH
jgi:hypothetical protein